MKVFTLANVYVSLFASSFKEQCFKLGLHGRNTSPSKSCVLDTQVSRHGLCTCEVIELCPLLRFDQEASCVLVSF